MKKKKLILATSYEIEVYGVSSALKGYRFCWYLGEVLGLEFQKMPEMRLPAATQTGFATYKSLQEESELCFVIENEYNGTFYQPKYKIADFFLVRYIDPYLQTVDNLKGKIQQIPQVQAVFEVDVSSKKVLEAFLLEE